MDVCNVMVAFSADTPSVLPAMASIVLETFKNLADNRKPGHVQASDSITK